MKIQNDYMSDEFALSAMGVRLTHPDTGAEIFVRENSWGGFDIQSNMGASERFTVCPGASNLIRIYIERQET